MKKGWIVVRHDDILGYLKCEGSEIELVDEHQMTWFDEQDPCRSEALYVAIQQDRFSDCLILECVRDDGVTNERGVF